MSGTNLVADTNIILYLFNGDKFIADLLNERQVYISFITELELLSYSFMTQKDKETIELFLTECSIIDITPAIKSKTIEFRKKYSLKIPDAIVISTAHYLNLPLITADKALKKVKDINIILFEPT